VEKDQTSSQSQDVDEETLRKAQNAAKDEFGVTQDNIKHFMNPNLMCLD
jgi:hypothetical protein